MTDRHSCPQRLAAVQAFHDQHDFRNTGGEELACRIARMAGECADLFILLPGTASAADFDLEDACWQKMRKREPRTVNGRIRVAEFRDT